MIVSNSMAQYELVCTVDGRCINCAAVFAIGKLEEPQRLDQQQAPTSMTPKTTTGMLLYRGCHVYRAFET